MKYSGKFYSEREQRTRHSANLILSILFGKILGRTPTSVIDVGCGTGVWLSEMENFGVENTNGIEGSWLPKTSFLAQLDNFHHEPVDLCLSLEVAEHLPESSAEGFVRNLVRFSDTILFSAAPIGQGGRYHFNERPISYWKEIFKRHGYSIVDIVRPQIWHNIEIPFWYRQNIVIFTKNTQLLEKYLVPDDRLLLDVIHPELFENYRYPRLYIAILQLLQFHKSILRTLKKRLKR